MYKSILLPIDLSDTAACEKAKNTAIQLAEQNKADLHVVAVLPNFSMPIVGIHFEEGFMDKTISAGKEHLTAYVAENVSTSASVQSHILQGTIYDEILKAADKVGCDLIVMASHRPAFKDYLLGPNAARVMRHAKQSVFIVRD